MSTTSTPSRRRSAKVPAPEFKVGDRVCFDPPMPAAFACVHGVVVNYHGEHDPKNPRVRWASGWGTSQKARQLRLLTETEVAGLPAPRLCDVDHEPKFDIRTLLTPEAAAAILPW